MPVPVRLRLARHGTRNNPFYHLVAINSEKARGARPIEKLGEYDPIPRIRSHAWLPSSSKVFTDPQAGELTSVRKEKKIEWDVERIRWWLNTGAQPTKSVVKLLERGGVLTVPHKWQHKYSPGLTSSTNTTSTSAELTTSTPSTTPASA